MWKYTTINPGCIRKRISEALHYAGKLHSYTAFYDPDGATGGKNFLTFSCRAEAIAFAKRHNWSYVVNDITGKVVYHSSKLEAE